MGLLLMLSFYKWEKSFLLMEMVHSILFKKCQKVSNSIFKNLISIYFWDQ